jgi:hypothetical protein
MRVVEVSGEPGGRGADSGQAMSGPAMSGPADDAGGHQFGARLRDTLAARHARQTAHAEDVRAADADALRSARKAGGKHAVTFLSSLLADDWMMIRGYQNAAGGIGQLLVGNHGVVAMTSLHLDATVHCHGDKWRAERFDHHDGRSLGEIHLADRAGLSPSAQLNLAADALEHFLRASGVETSVLRVVLLNHPRSVLESSHRPTVAVFGSPYDLARWLKERPKILDRAGRRQIERLLTPEPDADPS